MIVEIALMLSIIVVFAFVGPILVEKGKAYFDGQDCQTSIDRAIQLHQAATVFSSKITCPTQEYSFAGTDDQIKASVADALEKCWSRWHEGTTSAFSGDGVFCDVCARFAASGNKKITGMHQYLRDTPAKKGGSLYDYLSTPAGEIKTAVPDTFTTDKQQAVVFTYLQYVDSGVSGAGVRFSRHDEGWSTSCTAYPISQQ